MRHRAKNRQLSRTSSHRRAMLSNMATSLFQHGKVVTTVAKAKELRPVAEKLITLARRGDLHARRLVEQGVRFVQIFHGSNGGAGLIGGFGGSVTVRGGDVRVANVQTSGGSTAERSGGNAGAIRIGAGLECAREDMHRLRQPRPRRCTRPGGARSESAGRRGGDPLR